MPHWSSISGLTVSSPSPAIAGIAASMLDAVPATNERGERPVLFVVADPVLAAILDGSAIVPPGEWLDARCRELGVPVAFDGDFPFSDGVRALGEGVFLTRFESLHLLASPGEWMSRIADPPEFLARLTAASHPEQVLRRLYRSPLMKTLFRPIHRSMMRRKWAGEPRAHLPGEEVIVYHHIPKCAGMSVFHHLNEHLTWHDELVHLDARALEGVNAHGLTPFDRKDPRELDRIEVLFGHEVSLDDVRKLTGRAPLLATCLRDPASRMVSHYNWEMEQLAAQSERLPSFEEWYRGQERNWIVRWLARQFFRFEGRGRRDEELFADVSAKLEQFWIVCTLENFRPAMRRLTDKLGLPPIDTASNRAGESYSRRQELTPEIAARIEREHPLDVQLHRRWRDAA